MDIVVLASSSRGNCYMVGDGHTQLLIECGLPVRKIREGLSFGLSRVAGVLVTHEHQDHAKSTRDLLRAGIDVYMSAGTADAMMAKGHRLHHIKAAQQCTIGSFEVLPFGVEHDAAEPLGFLLRSQETGKKLLYATDTYYLRYRFEGLTHIMIECNYIKNILDANVDAGIVPKVLRDRLIESHFGLDGVKEMLAANDLSRVEGIWLLHMSSVNCDPIRAKREIQAQTGVPVYIAEEVAVCKQ